MSPLPRKNAPRPPGLYRPDAGGLEAIAALDPSFQPDDFTKGARKAYEMIVAAAMPMATATPCAPWSMTT